MGHGEVPSVGSNQSPLSLQIKGRGNSTWKKSPKKPFRLKLTDKVNLLGNGKSKHYVLLAGDEGSGFLKDAVGFEVARRIGFSFTPRCAPIEVVLNGDYRGLYLLCEKIRVDKNHVNVTEQENNDTIAENITGGWLLEIDSNPDDNQFEITEVNVNKMKFVVHSPDTLSKQQWNYIIDYVQRVDSAIFSKNPLSRKWESLIDTEALAKFYLMNEVVDNFEAFSGSCFMHKERGDDTRLIFGPVWDFGSSFGRHGQSFIYEPPLFYAHNKWIEQLAKFAYFQQAVITLWHEIYPDKLQGMEDYIEQYANRIYSAAIQDNKRWPESKSMGKQLLSQALRMSNRFMAKVSWLNEQWETFHWPGDVNGDERVNVSDLTTLVNMILGITEMNQLYADVNDDGRVNVSDLTALINIILGIY